MEYFEREASWNEKWQYELDLSQNLGIWASVFDVIDGVEKCPNCDEESYIWWKCESCDLGLWDEYEKNKEYEIQCNILQGQDKNSEKIKNITNFTKRLKVENGNYRSYEIEISNGMVKLLKFHHWKNKYRLFIDDYDIDSSIYTNWYGRDATSAIALFIRNIQLWKIQKKVGSWYGEAKNKVNDFRFEWLSYRTAIKFIEKVLWDYHKNKQD